jgi:hypothetical protein
MSNYQGSEGMSDSEVFKLKWPSHNMDDKVQVFNGANKVVALLDPTKQLRKFFNGSTEIKVKAVLTEENVFNIRRKL